MNLSVLLEKYRNSPLLFQLVDRLTMPIVALGNEQEGVMQKIFLKNLQGSSAEFVVSSIFTHPDCAQLNHLVVLNDAEDAAYFPQPFSGCEGDRSDAACGNEIDSPAARWLQVGE